MDIINRVYCELRAMGYDVTPEDIRLIHKDFCSSGRHDFMKYAIEQVSKWR